VCVCVSLSLSPSLGGTGKGEQCDPLCSRSLHIFSAAAAAQRCVMRWDEGGGGDMR
jgi:hypothetical protein